MNILLVCQMGASTGILVEKMKEAAKKEGGDYKIWANDIYSVKSELNNCDVILLGPQIRLQKNKIQGMVGESVPVEVIPPVDYGRCNGKAVLEFAKKIAKQEVEK